MNREVICPTSAADNPPSPLTRDSDPTADNIFAGSVTPSRISFSASLPKELINFSELDTSPNAVVS